MLFTYAYLREMGIREINLLENKGKRKKERETPLTGIEGETYAFSVASLISS